MAERKRYPIQALADAMGMTPDAACRALKVSGSTMVKYRAEGVTELVADRLATRAGHATYVVWPEMLDIAIEDAEQERRVRDAESKRRLYQEDAERREAKRAANRAYKAATREAQRKAARRYYEQNRDAALAQKRAHYQANREEQRARKRAYYQANRERILERQRAYDRARAAGGRVGRDGEAA